MKLLPTNLKRIYNFFFNPKSTWMFFVTFALISWVLVTILNKVFMFFDSFLYPQISFIVVGGIFFYLCIKYFPKWGKFDDQMRNEQEEEELKDLEEK